MLGQEAENTEPKLVIPNDTDVNQGDTVTDTVENQVDTATDTDVNQLDTTENQGDTITDTEVNQGDTLTDTDVNQGDTIIDTEVNQGDTITDTDVNQGDTVTDTVVNQGDTVTDTELNQGDTVTDTEEDIDDWWDTLPSRNDEIPDDNSGGTNDNSGGTKQYGTLRLGGKQGQVFEEIATKLKITNYALLHRIVRDFVAKVDSINVVNEELIRRDESAKCAERTESLMKSFISVTTHQKEVKDLTEFYESELKQAAHNLEVADKQLEATNKQLEGFKSTEEYKLVVGNLPAVRACMSFFRELELLDSKMYPESFIISYKSIRKQLSNLRNELGIKHEQEIDNNSQKLKESFIKIIQEIVDLHVQYPFISGEGIYDKAIQQLSTI